jgi:flagellin-specific chaperone FliS
MDDRDWLRVPVIWDLRIRFIGTKNMPSTHYATQSYRTIQVNGASPLDLLIMTYDAALAACNRQDLLQLTKALGVLRDALDYSYDAEIALGFFRLYQYCGELARQDQFDEAAFYLREIREDWGQVREQYRTNYSLATPPPQDQSQETSDLPTRLVIAG